nr:hypothetical protein [Tanacetum cinerariifolium]
MPTQEYVRKIIEDDSEDDHFTRGPWLSVIVYLHGEGVMASGCLGDMKKYCKNRKLEMVVGVVMSCTPNSLGDMAVTLKDPTGSFREETDKITDLHQIHEEVLFTERGDGVTCIKRCRRDLSSDDVKDLVTASRRGRLKEDLESSTQ